MRHIALSALSGLLIAAAMPPWGWWPLAIIGLAIWFCLIDDPSRKTRFTTSLIVALAWSIPATLWMFDLTPAGWPVSVLLFSSFLGLAGMATPSQRPIRRIVFPAGIVLAELVRWSWPFGGIPLANLAMAEVASPLAPVARLFGSLFLVMITVVVAVTLVDLVRRDRHAIAGGIAVLIAVAAGMIAMSIDAPKADTLDVAVVQGGGPQNTRADICENRTVFERHMSASHLIDRPVDLVLWPENVVNPVADGLETSLCNEPLLWHSEAADRLAELAGELDAVLVSGWFERTADDTANVNYSIATSPDGTVTGRYDKVRLVPFGEFVPLRSLIELFSGELPSHDTRPGHNTAVIDSAVGRLGVSISWEIFFDTRARDAIDNGGQVLLNPTNGSSYWLTILQSQQIASSQLRAIETDRWVLQAAPTGFSAIVNPDGDVIERTGVSEQRVLYATIELHDGRTLAVRWGVWPTLLTSLAVMGWAWLPMIDTERLRRKFVRPRR